MKKVGILFFVFLLLGGALLLSSCSDDSETEKSEVGWKHIPKDRSCPLKFSKPVVDWELDPPSEVMVDFSFYRKIEGFSPCVYVNLSLDIEERFTVTDAWGWKYYQGLMGFNNPPKYMDNPISVTTARVSPGYREGGVYVGPRALGPVQKVDAPLVYSVTWCRFTEILDGVQRAPLMKCFYNTLLEDDERAANTLLVPGYQVWLAMDHQGNFFWALDPR